MLETNVQWAPTESAQIKLNLMSEKFPDVKLELIDGVKYDELKVQFKHLLISVWEGK